MNQIKQEPVIIKVEVEVQITQDDIDFLLKYTDIFQQGYIGYWAYGVRFDSGWIVVEEESFIDEYDAKAIDKAVDKAIEYYKANQDLDAFPISEIHVIDRKAAEKIWAHVAQRVGIVEAYGNKEIADWDADDLDVAIQQVLLGSYRYA